MTTNNATRIMLEITYTNGNTLRELVNYAHIDNGVLSYTVNKQLHEMVQDRVTVTLGEKVAAVDLFPVLCDGWDPIGDIKPGFTVGDPQ